MYHSWTTFVLLLWALILWMLPDKRASMMKCSPFIVFYATLLLLGQFVYSMDLTDEELPSVVSGVKMSEIGFSKANELSRWHLIVKVHIPYKLDLTFAEINFLIFHTYELYST